MVVPIERPEARAVRRDDNAAGHAEMDDEHAAIIEMHQDVLGAPGDALDPLALDLRLEAGRQWNPQIRPVEIEPRNAAPLHVHREAAADGFDFRKFRHDPSRVSGAAERGTVCCSI